MRRLVYALVLGGLMCIATAEEGTKRSIFWAFESPNFCFSQIFVFSYTLQFLSSMSSSSTMVLVQEMTIR